MDGLMVLLGVMGLQASVVICVVLAVRQLFSRAHIAKKYVMPLWMVAFFLFICPWKIESPAGFWGHAPVDYAPGDLQQMAVFERRSETDEMVLPEDPSWETKPEGLQSAHTKSRDTGSGLEHLLSIAGVIWMAGLAFLFLHGAATYWRLKQKTLCSVVGEDGAYHADDIQVPMILGVVYPRIYIPSGIPKERSAYIIAHEETHLKRKDHVVKPACYIIACIHWFQPFSWIAFYFMAKDMEMACDEETVARLGAERKKEYAAALLEQSAGNRYIFFVPPAFGGENMKMRIKNVLRYQKTTKLSAVLSIIAILLVAAVFLTKSGNVSAKKNTSAGKSAYEDVKGTAGRSSYEDTKGTAGRSSYKDTKGTADKGTSDRTRTSELTFDMVREMFAEQTVEQYDFHQYANGEEQYFTDEDAMNYYIDFTYEYEGEPYRLAVSCLLDTDALSDIYLYRLSDMEMAWIYSAEEEEDPYRYDLETFLASKIEIGDLLAIDLPKGYELGAYQGNLGNAGGALIYPESYETVGDPYAPEPWVSAGFFGRLPDASVFLFRDGKLDGERVPMDNHSLSETIAVLEDLDWPAILCRTEHDLYTAAELGEMEKNGTDLTKIDTTSVYWYFYFAKEGEAEAYYLSLSAKEFTQEEALDIARTVKIYP